MDGLVLSFDAGEGRGLIRAEDGTRYTFAGGDWKSAETPSEGLRVDFVPDGGSATEIYVVRSAARASAAGGTEGPAPNDAASYLRERPAMILAGVMLLGCLLPFLSVPFFSMTVLSIPSTASFFINLAGAFGANTEPGIGGIRAAVWSLYLLYAIPAAAGWLIFREIGSAASRRLALAVGVIGLATPFVTTVVSTLIVRAGEPAQAAATRREIPGPGDAILQLLSYIGIGWMLIIIAGIGLVAIGSGWSPFGARARRD